MPSSHSVDGPVQKLKAYENKKRRIPLLGFCNSSIFRRIEKAVGRRFARRSHTRRRSPLEGTSAKNARPKERKVLRRDVSQRKGRSLNEPSVKGGGTRYPRASRPLCMLPDLSIAAIRTRKRSSRFRSLNNKQFAKPGGSNDRPPPSGCWRMLSHPRCEMVYSHLGADDGTRTRNLQILNLAP